jgi:hypothetical protein
VSPELVVELMMAAFPEEMNVHLLQEADVVVVC